jgi:transposase InsO family protein
LRGDRAAPGRTEGRVAAGTDQRAVLPIGPESNVSLSLAGAKKNVNYVSLGTRIHYLHVYATKAELVAAIDKWVTFYNSVRRHSALGMISPDDHESSLRAAA